MTLDAAPLNARLTITDMKAELKLRQKLETLGLIPGQSVCVVSRSGGGVIIEVKDSRLAVSNALAGCLEVR